jgi:hypothetical protein
MNFDLRFPIGIMFTLFGAMLVIFGLATKGNEMYTIHSLGKNINLSWGFILLIFGVVMLLLAIRGKKSGPPPK